MTLETYVIVKLNSCTFQWSKTEIEISQSKTMEYILLSNCSGLMRSIFSGIERLSSFLVIYYPIEHFFLPYFDFSLCQMDRFLANQMRYLAQSGTKITKLDTTHPIFLSIRFSMRKTKAPTIRKDKAAIMDRNTFLSVFSWSINNRIRKNMSLLPSQHTT